LFSVAFLIFLFPGKGGALYFYSNFLLRKEEVMNRFSDFFFLCKNLKWLLFVLALPILMPANVGALTVSPANFGEQIYHTNNFTPGFFTIKYVEGTVERSDSIIGAGSLNGSASTSGSVLPMASFDLSLEGQGIGINGGAYAALTYYWGVEQIAGAPYGSLIPVKISTAGSVSGSTSGDATIGYLYAKVILGWGGSFEADLTNQTGAESFNKEFTKNVYKDTQYSFGLIVRGEGWAEDGGSVNIGGYVDPIIVIDPDWSRAGDFKLVFSAGISGQPSSAAVPEPATVLLLGSGLAAIGWKRRKGFRKFRNRSPQIS
jgi:hypothetical protein